MANWIISANPKKYKVFEAFQELKKLNWTQSASSISIGDTVYIYVSAPYQEIRFKCKVNRVRLDQNEIDDSKYDINGEYSQHSGLKMELELLQEYEPGYLSKDVLSDFGFDPPQGPMHIKQEVLDYIQLYEHIQNCSSRDEQLLAFCDSPSFKVLEKNVEEKMKLRETFVKDYPVERIEELSMEQYCVGFKSSKKDMDFNTFCYRIEFELRNLGSMKGSSSQKFGVYYSPQTEEYSFANKYGDSLEEAFDTIKNEIYKLLVAGEKVDIESINNSMVAPIFKMKLLSTYYPEQYPAIFNDSLYDNMFEFLHIEAIPGETIIEKNQRLQHFKNNHPATCEWKNQLFTDIVGGKIAVWKNLKDTVTSRSNNSELNVGNTTLGIKSARTQYWIMSAGENASKWDFFYDNSIIAIGWNEIGDLRQYESKNDIKQAMKETYDSSLSYKNVGHAAWQLLHDVKVGDVIYIKKGRSKLVGRGIIASEYEYDENYDRDYVHIRKVKWTHKGEWDYPGNAPLKTLTDLTPYDDLVEDLKMIFEDPNEEDTEKEIETVYDSYTKEDFLKDVFMDEDNYIKLANLLKRKKNIILQGAPGVGKTYIARRLAYSLMGVKDESRVAFIQFHQSYSYEDFIMGYRPTQNGGFELHKGAFYKFCKEAEDDSDNDYFFIIDEINRGNLSKIFGELFMLIESDKRGAELKLIYANEKFKVPSNLYIIGMMNTADRSLAMIDYALRRRFAFFEMKPGFDTEGFIDYEDKKQNNKFKKLIDTVRALNDAIASDDSLGSGFCIGHSYFVTDEPIDDEWLFSVVEYELIPLLQEYWFDETDKVEEWSDRLKRAIK